MSRFDGGDESRVAALQAEVERLTTERDEALLLNAELERQLREGVSCVTCGTKFHGPDLDAPCPVCRQRALLTAARDVIEDRYNADPTHAKKVLRRIDTLLGGTP